jgi:hypothetical protein
MEVDALPTDVDALTNGQNGLLKARRTSWDEARDLQNA